jgi:hypothetical protein
MSAEILSLIARLRVACADVTSAGPSMAHVRGRSMLGMGKSSRFRAGAGLQLPLARGDGELPLSGPVRSAMLAAKLRVSGECRLISL